VFISDLALVVFGGILWRAAQAYGWAWLTCVYIIPYLVVCPTVLMLQHILTALSVCLTRVQ
jgi:hypothetical protein